MWYFSESSVTSVAEKRLIANSSIFLSMTVSPILADEKGCYARLPLPLFPARLTGRGF
jgi:hypothetical protein